MAILRSTIVFCASFALTYAQIQPKLHLQVAKLWGNPYDRESTLGNHMADDETLNEYYESLRKRSSFVTFQTNNSTTNSTWAIRNGTSTKAASAAGLGVVFGQGSPAVDSSSTSQGASTTQGSTADALEPILARYAQFSAIAYTTQCAKPKGADMVQYFGASPYGLDDSEPAGYVAIDANKAELIVV